MASTASARPVVPPRPSGAVLRQGLRIIWIGAAEMAERLKVAIGALTREPWLVLEDKGAALTFHFRTAPDPDIARADIMAIVDATDSDRVLVRSVSRRAIELRPSTASTKGDTLLRLARDQGADVVFMLGDDRNDAVAFDALRQARAAERLDGLAIAVAGHPDFASDVVHRADAVLSGPAQAALLLSLMARAIDVGDQGSAGDLPG